MKFLDRVMTIVAPDGKRRMEPWRRDDGFFEFREEAEASGETRWEPDFYWTTTYASGLHETAAAAEREARPTLPWIRDLP